MSGRFARENFDRAGYERQLAAFREALKGTDASAPTMAVELAELERLVHKYPIAAAEFLAAHNSPYGPPPRHRPG
jgi:hypothetical protein